jgi:hypothetical protein
MSNTVPATTKSAITTTYVCMIAGDTDAESAAKGLLNMAGCPGLIWQNVRCVIGDLLDYFSLVKRRAGLKAMIYVQYFPNPTLSLGSAIVQILAA